MSEWLALALALAATAAGLLLVRSATALARWLAWVVTLAFAGAITLAPAVEWTQRPAVAATAVLADDAAAAAGDALVAAARAGPAALALRLQRLRPDAAWPTGALGAVVELPPALPLQPDELALAGWRAAERDRPLALQVRAPQPATASPAGAPLRATLRIEHAGQVALERELELGAAAVDVAFTPVAAGPHAVELRVALPPHTLLARGAFVVTEPAPVLVLEPSGLVATALRAQGIAATTATALPADLKDLAAVVVGQPLAAAEQALLGAAVRGGVGAFVLAPGFGGEGEPLRDLLPLRPLPQQPEPGPGEGQGSAAGDAPPPATPPTTPPPASPPPPPPRPDQPPRGDTRGASRIAPDPIEVDKRAIALVLVVDRSGSMGTVQSDGATKMSYAKTAALRTAQALGEGDTVGIVTFGNKDAARVELRLTDAADTAAVRTGVERLAHANERTYLLDGLRKAYDLLAEADAAVKHVVVVTDGEFFVEEEVGLRAIAHRMRGQQRATVSIISIVDESIGPTFARAAVGITQDGGGQFFEVRDAGKVPAFVSAEVTRSLQKVGREPRAGEGAGDGPPAPPTTPPTTPPPPPPPDEREPDPPPAPPAEPTAPKRVPVRAVADSALLAPPPPAGWPTLGRAVAGTAPFDATVLLVAGDEGWPLLAFGNRGLGRVGAFAADLAGEAGAEFRADPAFPGRLAQWLQSVLPVRPAVAPASLLTGFDVTPPAPTPRDAAAATALAGSPPVPPGAAPELPATARRTLVPAAPAAAPWLLGLLVLLALGERVLGARALRRSAA